MANIYTSADELIGGTPLLELTHIEKQLGLKAKILAKLEYLNPAGSVKDRIAKAMIEDAENSGKLKAGSVIIEPTSGNTGIGLASVAAARGYRIIIVMPETMSVERRQLMKAYGAELVLTDGTKGMKGAIAEAERLEKETPGGVILGQFTNPANPQAHINTTGPEIYNDTDGKVDIFVAGVGTGGTVTGVGKYLKSKNADIKIVAVEPSSSPVLSKGTAVLIKYRVSAQASSPRCLIPTSMTRSSPLRMTMPLSTASLSGRKRACLSAYPPAQQFSPQSSLQSARRTQARPSWPCCPIQATDTSLPRFLQTETKTHDKPRKHPSISSAFRLYKE